MIEISGVEQSLMSNKLITLIMTPTQYASNKEQEIYSGFYNLIIHFFPTPTKCHLDKYAVIRHKSILTDKSCILLDRGS